MNIRNRIDRMERTLRPGRQPEDCPQVEDAPYRELAKTLVMITELGLWPCFPALVAELPESDRTALQIAHGAVADEVGGTG